MVIRDKRNIVMKNRKNLNKEQTGKLSRREFMGAAAAAAAFTFVPRHVLGGRRYISPSEKLNVACIGVGGMGGVMSARSVRKI